MLSARDIWNEYLATLIITSLLALVIIATFPFCLLALLEAKDSADFIFSFFLRDFLKAFLALRFCEELVIKTSFKDIDLSNLKSSLSALGTLPLNKNKLRYILSSDLALFSLINTDTNTF